MEDFPRLYTDLAPWWSLLSDAADYAEEAAWFAATILRHRPQTRTVLELGCGGGNNACHLKKTFDMTLSDYSPGMVEVSRALNPELEHVVGDMRTLRLRRQFDAVFIHDAIMYMTSEEDLRKAMRTAAAHCRAGGMVLIVPDMTTETASMDTSTGGEDGPDGRSLRYLSWSWDPDPDDCWFYTEYVYLLREQDGTVQTVHDRHREGLFPKDVWLEAIASAGMEAVELPKNEDDPYSDSRPLFAGFPPH